MLEQLIQLIDKKVVSPNVIKVTYLHLATGSEFIVTWGGIGDTNPFKLVTKPPDPYSSDEVLDALVNEAIAARRGSALYLEIIDTFSAFDCEVLR